MGRRSVGLILEIQRAEWYSAFIDYIGKIHIITVNSLKITGSISNPYYNLENVCRVL